MAQEPVSSLLWLLGTQLIILILDKPHVPTRIYPDAHAQPTAHLPRADVTAG